MKPTTHTITFPSREPGGRPYTAEVDAPTFELAQRAALEHAAANGIELAWLRISHVADLRGAVLDGLKLTRCTVSDVSLAGASLRNAQITDCLFGHVLADDSTNMSDSQIDRLDIEQSHLPGLKFRGAQIGVLRLYQTCAKGWDLTGADLNSFKAWGLSDTSAWQLLGCRLSNVTDIGALIASSAHTENEKGAIRLLSSTGNRAQAVHWLEELNTQEA